MKKFNPGKIVMTPGVFNLKKEILDKIPQFINRHIQGDWGDLCDEDKNTNNLFLEEGERLFSSYITEGKERIWIITEADRSVTTILLPDDY
jgi:hypothetical protein